ncbi:MAG: PepSY domain-containing protein [Alteromonadaceae bacterium]|nr:PepSY domain-containing protein [Alteromonadaceae bacterium]
MNRKFWHNIHHWVGFKLALFLCFILASGTLAVISHELDWLTNVAVRAEGRVANQDLNWAAFYRAALAQAGNDTVYQLAVPEHSGFAAEALVKDENQRRYRLYFDPVTWQYNGEGRWFNWQTSLRRIHRHLMLPLNVGLTLVAASSILFLCSLVTGLILQRQWWRGLWRWPRRTNPRVFWSDLHRLAGLWSSWLLVIVSITGLWYLVEKYGLGATYPQDAKAISTVAQQSTINVSETVFANVMHQVSEHRPALQVKRVFLPVKSMTTIRIDGQEDELLVRDRANNMIFDPLSGELLSTRRGEDLSLHVRISEAADPLHFGTWGGLTTKLVYFMFGVVLTLVCLSGTYIYALRLLPVRRHQQIPQRLMFRAAVPAMGWGSGLSAGLIVVCAGMTLLTILSY